MKKVTLFLCLLLTALVCQATNIVDRGTKLHLGNAINSNVVPSGYYIIKSKSDTYSATPYLVASSASALGLAADPRIGGTNIGLWKIALVTAPTDGNTKSSEYYLLNVSNSNYITSGPSVPLGGTKQKHWINRTADGTYQFGLSSTSFTTDAIGATSTSAFHRTAEGRATDFELIPVYPFETPASVEAATKWYRLEGKPDKGGYVSYNSTGNTLSLVNTPGDDDLWCFVPQADGTFKVYSRTDKTKCWGAFDVTTANTSGSIKLTDPNNTSASATTFQILPTYADYPYMGFRINTDVSSTAYINQISGRNLGSWNNAQAIYGYWKDVNTNITGNGDDGSSFKIHECEVSDIVNYTIITHGAPGGGVTYSGNNYSNGQIIEASTFLSANDFTALAVEGFTVGLTISEVSTFEFNVDVYYATNNPITPTTITDGAFAENTQWYRLIINRSPKKYAKFDKINNVTENSTSKTTDRNSFFCFVKDPDVENGFKIYNMAAGTRKAFTSTGANNEICTYSETGTTFILEHNTIGTDGYQFRVNGFDQAYFNDVNSKIGVWNYSAAATDAGGTFMIVEGTVTSEELSSLTADFTELNIVIAKAEQYTIGTGVGQYVDNSGGEFTTALNAAKALDQERTDVAYQSTIDEAMENLQAAFPSLSLNMPATERYYRLRVASQSAENDNYMSAYGNGTSLNTKVVTSQAPTIFYLTADNKLQAVYNDAYISNEAASNSAPLATTTVADDAMVWTITGSEVTPGTYNLKAGNNDLYLYDWTTYSRNNTLVANNKNDRRCQWTIEEVELNENLIKEFDLGLLNFSKSLETIPLIEGAEIICPSEYTYTPEALNAAITTIKAVTNSNTLAEVKSALNSNEYGIASHYKGLCDEYGVALSVSLTMKGQYSTLIAPINYTRPTNWAVYSCSATQGNVLTLNTFNQAYKNKPLIIEYTDEATMPTQEAPKTFQLIGYSNGAGTENVSEGFLTGVLSAETTTIPTGSYVLALDKNTGKQAFYKTNGSVVCPMYRCYLTVPTTLTNAFYFDNEGTTTGIEAIFGGENEEVVIYDLSGKRLSRLQKGVNIVNGHKVIVK